MKKVSTLIIAGLMVVSLFCGCGSRRDVTHDPNGFLGYSDDFWEWQMEQ